MPSTRGWGGGHGFHLEIETHPPAAKLWHRGEHSLELPLDAARGFRQARSQTIFVPLGQTSQNQRKTKRRAGPVGERAAAAPSTMPTTARAQAGRRASRQTTASRGMPRERPPATGPRGWRRGRGNSARLDAICAIIKATQGWETGSAEAAFLVVSPPPQQGFQSAFNEPFTSIQ